MPVNLSPTEGKVLRYVVTREEPVNPSWAIVKIAWSDLPKTFMSSVKTLDALVEYGFVEKVGSSYRATKAGIRFSKNNNHRWNK